MPTSPSSFLPAALHGSRVGRSGARSVHVDLLVPDLNMYWITIELGAGHEDDLGGGA
jgi:hypothetical protein